MKNGRYKSVADLERAASSKLSNFNGNNVNQYPVAGFDGYPEGFDGIGYTGLNDPFMSFAGGGSHFGDPSSEDRQFQMSLANATVANGTVYLTMGLGYLKAYVKNTANNGLAMDGLFDATEGTDITGTGSPNTIASFQAFLFNNPSQLLGLKITSTTDAQIARQIEYGWDSPFFTPGSRTIKPGNGVDQYVTKDKTVVISLKDVILNDQTYLKYVIGAGETVVIDFMLGAALNKGEAMQKLAKIAQANISLAGKKRVDAITRYANAKGATPMTNSFVRKV